ncbi:MAG: dihydrodipicolinate synthase family protein [Armatimonadetes bacterium]|nr:dihydrodipicolinate synthase family protein [Armatimonadota bacterium]
MLPTGVYPASVTPYDSSGKIDVGSFAKLIAYFRASGCSGIVVSGSNGEGPSMSSPEKRDLLRTCIQLSHGLPVILGLATSSMEDARWLTNQAGASEAAAVLALPPSFYKNVEEDGIRKWFMALMETKGAPLLYYHHPKLTGIEVSIDFLRSLAEHPKFLGLKDSSGNPENLKMFREVLPEKQLFVGDENLIIEALDAGWNGTISGASNVCAPWMSALISDYTSGNKESAQEKFKIIQPAIQKMRSLPQPPNHKAVLHNWGIIDCPFPRLPYLEADPTEELQILRETIGVHRDNIGVPRP